MCLPLVPTEGTYLYYSTSEIARDPIPTLVLQRISPLLDRRKPSDEFFVKASFPFFILVHDAKRVMMPLSTTAAASEQTV